MQCNAIVAGASQAHRIRAILRSPAAQSAGKEADEKTWPGSVDRSGLCCKIVGSLGDMSGRDGEMPKRAKRDL